MRQRDQRGASLILVLFVTAFLSTLVSALLGLTFNGASITSSVKQDRKNTYVATSGLDGAVQYGRTARWVGRPGLVCPTMTVTIDGVTAIVTCTSTTGPFDLDRTVAYVATIDGRQVSRASVVFRDGTAGAGEPAVDVVTWG